MRRGDEPILARERAFFNDRYRPSRPGIYGWEQFAQKITPAYVSGGAPGGLVHRRAYDLLVAAGVRGRRILDYACGQGSLGLHLAQLGADVRGFDLSESGIENARARAAYNGISSVRFDVADARALPYADGEFDAVIGFSAVEHVIKYRGSGDELRRVMKPHATAYFTENYGQNLLINAARKITMRGQEDAGDVLLTDKLVTEWAEGFEVEIEGYSLLFMLKRVMTQNHILRALYLVDEALFALFPRLRRFGGECVIILRPR
jgi:SAM-dependent methyltransferase